MSKEFDKMTPAEHWSKITELVETLKLQCEDLEESLNDYRTEFPF